MTVIEDKLKSFETDKNHIQRRTIYALAKKSDQIRVQRIRRG